MSLSESMAWLTQWRWMRSASRKTALEQYNSKMMDAAISRDDKNRTKINEEKINTIVKNSDTPICDTDKIEIIHAVGGG